MPVGGGGQARIMHGFVDRDSAADIGSDCGFAVARPLGASEDVVDAVSGNEDDTGFIAEHIVAVVNWDAVDGDRPAARDLLQAVSCGARRDPRENTGNWRSRASAMSRHSPSAITPRTPRCWLPRDSSPPQQDTSVRPWLATTTTSPGWAFAIADVAM